MRKQLDIIFEDDHLIAINKAPGIFTLPDRFKPDLPNLRTILTRKYGDIYVVHRLDVETSGVIVFAKTAEAHVFIQSNWSEKTTIKEYKAITIKPAEAKGIINAAIVESNSKKGFYKVHDKGKYAETHYEVITDWNQYALVNCKILTGRTHQIRVHMKYIGAPLLIDKKYGVSNAFYLSQIKRVKFSRDQEERPLFKRSSLHATSLSIIHPATKKSIKFEADFPKDFKAIINQMNKSKGTSTNRKMW